MKLYGIIGNPLGHSFSPKYFNEKFIREGINATYKLFPLKTIVEFPELFKSHSELVGLSVTIPYKKEIIDYLDCVDFVAKKIGAVNCIQFKDGKTTGYNTDAIGFRKSLEPLLQPHHKNALILGTGGASNAVAYVLSELGIGFKKVSRNKTKDGLCYSELKQTVIEQYSLIINTTPLGMFPKFSTCPADIDYNALSTKNLLYDLVYNPEETDFLKRGKQKGATIKNGLEMLHLQAEAAWEIWNLK